MIACGRIYTDQDSLPLCRRGDGRPVLSRALQRASFIIQQRDRIAVRQICRRGLIPQVRLLLVMLRILREQAGPVHVDLCFRSDDVIRHYRYRDRQCIGFTVFIIPGSVKVSCPAAEDDHIGRVVIQHAQIILRLRRCLAVFRFRHRDVDTAEHGRAHRFRFIRLFWFFRFSCLSEPEFNNQLAFFINIGAGKGNDGFTVLGISQKLYRDALREGIARLCRQNNDCAIGLAGFSYRIFRRYIRRTLISAVYELQYGSSGDMRRSFSGNTARIHTQ